MAHGMHAGVRLGAGSGGAEALGSGDSSQPGSCSGRSSSQPALAAVSSRSSVSWELQPCGLQR